MSLFICGNDSWYFYFYRFDASSPMVSSSLSPFPSGGKLDPPVRITLSNQVLRTYQVVNRLVPIVDGLNVGKCGVTSTIGELKSFPTLCPQLQDFSSFTDLIYFKTEKASLSPPHLPQTMLCHATCSNKRVNIGWGGGGGGVGDGLDCMYFRTRHLATVSAVKVFWPNCRLCLSCPE